MPSEGTPRVRAVRAAEVIGSLCLATDLSMGFPFEHGFHSTLVAMRLADRLDVDHHTASQVYYACLLTYAGCTADAEIAVETFGGDLLTHFHPVMFGSQLEMLRGIVRALPAPDGTPARRAVEIASRLPKAARGNRAHLAALCEVAQMLTERMGLPPSVSKLFVQLTERWDGKGPLGRAKGEDIPLALRIVHVARDASFQHLLGGVELAAQVVRERAGHAFDPAIATLLADNAAELLVLDAAKSTWEETLEREPFPQLELDGEAVDRALAAMGDFADLMSPYMVGHSSGVASLAENAAQRCRFSEAEREMLRRAAFVHDLGRVAISARIWLKPAPLTADESEQVRLHPYYTERILAPSPFLSKLAPTASAHHERMDGSGYHRGSSAAALSPQSRLLAAADAYQAMTERRPHREALSADDAADALADETRAGRLDAQMVEAVIEAAGQRPPRLPRPAGLTEREAEVVALVARGMQTKQIARALGISTKTADRHLQNAYGKMGVSTRAAAALFAMEHGLTTWGELPISAAPARS